MGACAKPSEIFLLLFLLFPLCLCPLSIPRLQLLGSPSNRRRPCGASTSRYRQRGCKDAEIKESEASEGSTRMGALQQLCQTVRQPSRNIRNHLLKLRFLHCSGTEAAERHRLTFQNSWNRTNIRPSRRAKANVCC